MNFKNVKLVVSDMDGTLLHSDYSINPEFFNIYEKLKSLGISFSVASGRQYYSLLKIFDSIKNDIYFIAENGGNLVYCGKTLITREINQDLISEVIKLCVPISGAEVLLCGIKSAYASKSAPEFAEHIKQYYPKNKVLSSLSEPLEDEIVKIAIYNREGVENSVYPIVSYLNKEYNVKISGKHWVDISLKNSNKGEALKEVQKRLNISKEETMVFGDYLNDEEMMHEAFYSFAMENAHPDLKKSANFETVSNDQDGVLKILQEVIRQNS
ncbi:HAD family hydrolase [Apibacter raozihei]|uniref:HAD family hydrolase n=1 Tax=Apibacter raozihei TaxID=2500547 RepID=UPI000FE3B7BD